MDIFDVLTLIGGLCLFLFGMNLMGQALERRAGDGLRALLGKLTGSRWAGLLTGLGSTAVIQSSSATTVMVVGFVNSGLMALRQAIYVIMGANVGTTVTAWLLSLAGVGGGSLVLKLLKPSSFTPILALIGIICTQFGKNTKRKDTGVILLGFATLMTGMETMSGAVAGLGESPAFRSLFLLFDNPLLGLLAGALLTALLQSSSASVGILQALAVTGQVSYGAAIPIIMGQNIGTCVTAMLSAIGASKNAKRAAMVHLLFNVIGSGAYLGVFWIIKAAFQPMILAEPAGLPGIAFAHSAFNVLCTLLLLPLAGFLEKLVCRLVPEGKKETEEQTWLDERLLATPAIALERCRDAAAEMARIAGEALEEALGCVKDYSPGRAESVKQKEEQTDRAEDALGTYLVRVSALPLSAADSGEAAGLLKVIGDFERIADHAVNLTQSARELQAKNLRFSPQAEEELNTLRRAVRRILSLSLDAFLQNDPKAAALVEPLEQVIDQLKEQLRTRHIRRLQSGECSMGAGFVWTDLLTDLERTSDHCSNIAGCVMELAHRDLNLHESLRTLRNESPEYKKAFQAFANKYALFSQQE